MSVNNSQRLWYRKTFFSLWLVLMPIKSWERDFMHWFYLYMILLFDIWRIHSRISIQTIWPARHYLTCEAPAALNVKICIFFYWIILRIILSTHFQDFLNITPRTLICRFRYLSFRYVSAFCFIGKITQNPLYAWSIACTLPLQFDSLGTYWNWSFMQLKEMVLAILNESDLLLSEDASEHIMDLFSTPRKKKERKYHVQGSKARLNQQTRATAD